mgnify:CR=1 FL=1
MKKPGTKRKELEPIIEKLKEVTDFFFEKVPVENLSIYYSEPDRVTEGNADIAEIFINLIGLVQDNKSTSFKVMEFAKRLSILSQLVSNSATEMVGKKRTDDAIAEIEKLIPNVEYEDPIFELKIDLPIYNFQKAGEAIGVSRQTINNWIKNESNPLKTVPYGKREGVEKQNLIKYYNQRIRTSGKIK